MSDSDSPARRRERAVLEALDEAGPLTVPELAARLDAHPVTIERCCLELQRAGRLRQCLGGALVRSNAGGNARAVGD